LEVLLPDSEEVKILKENHRELTKSNEARLQSFAKKFIKTNNKINDEKIETNRKTIPNKCYDLLMKIPNAGKNLTLFAIKLPFKLAFKGISVATSVIVFPLQVMSNSAKALIGSPVKWILNKFDPFSN
jgi:hypothetical protein